MAMSPNADVAAQTMSSSTPPLWVRHPTELQTRTVETEPTEKIKATAPSLDCPQRENHFASLCHSGKKRVVAK